MLENAMDCGSGGGGGDSGKGCSGFFAAMRGYMRLRTTVW